MSLPHRAAAVAAVLFCALLMPATPPASATDAGPTTLTLYGDSGRGWGLNRTTTTTPGPTITVYLGYPVTLTLVGADPPPAQITHNWFIDYNGNNQTDPVDNKSDNFISPASMLFTFVPTRARNATCNCHNHFGTTSETI